MYLAPQNIPDAMVLTLNNKVVLYRIYSSGRSRNSPPAGGGRGGGEGGRGQRSDDRRGSQRGGECHTASRGHHASLSAPPGGAPTRSAQYNTVQYSIAQCNTVQYNAVQYSTIRCNTMQYK